MRSHGLKPLWRSGLTSRTEFQNTVFTGSNNLGPQVVIANLPPVCRTRLSSRNADVHVRYEKDAEHTDHGVEASVFERQVGHVAGLKLDVLETELLRFRACQFEQVLGKVHTDTDPPGPTIFAAGIAEAPLPQHTSNTRCPGAIPAARPFVAHTAPRKCLQDDRNSPQQRCKWSPLSVWQSSNSLIST